MERRAVRRIIIGMDCLAIWPRFPDSYWSFRDAFRGTPYRAAMAPLPLLTVAGAAPPGTRWRLWDENVDGPVREEALRGADRAFLSGMLIQRRSIRRILALAARAGVPTVLGGPCVTQEPELFSEASDRVVGELEGLPADFWSEIAAPAPEPRIWRARPTPDIARAPVPRFDLATHRRYHSHAVQWSRGCPFNCEFCDIIEIYGRTPRTKPVEQMLQELEALHRTGYRGDVFFVDDNFIGNAAAAARLLPALARWQRDRRRPFRFYTEASLNLAARPELLRGMVEAGFDNVFCGIETPDAGLLAAAQKRQNTAVDLERAVGAIHRAGLGVKAGFIMGFDGEDGTIFERQRKFIQSAAIPMAMVGLLRALPGTQLTRRLAREGRLVASGADDGDHFDAPNFRTTMPLRPLLEGYRRLLAELYAPRAYFERVVGEILRRPPAARPDPAPPWGLRTIFLLLVDAARTREGARAFFAALARVALRRPRALTTFFGFAAQLRHFARYTRDVVLPRLERAAAAAPAG